MYKTRNKFQKENWEKQKQVETKQHATKIQISQWRNQRLNQKIPQDRWKWKQSFSKSMRYRKSSSKREVNCNKGLCQKTRKIQNKQHNVLSKGIRKRKGYYTD